MPMYTNIMPMLLWCTKVCGNSTDPVSFPLYICLFCIHFVGVTLVIVLESAYKDVAYGFMVYTAIQGLFVFIASIALLVNLFDSGSSVFLKFSFVRNLTSVIFLLALSIFYMHIALEGEAFSVPLDVRDMSTPLKRLEFFLTSLYASIGILSSVGYGDIIPTAWYARIIILPNFMFTFLANAMIFSAFTRFYAKHNV